MEIFTSLSPEQWALLLGGIVAIGAMAGFLAGLLGIGGGIVLVPGIYFLFETLGFESPNLMHLAVGTSLSIIIPTGFSSARAHWKKGSVDISLIKLIAPGILIGVLGGTLLASRLSGEDLRLVFAVAIMVLALIMLGNPARFNLLKEIPGRIGSGIAGIVIGGVSTLVGVGGATMSVPYMSIAGVPVHRAVGTASALGLFIAVPGALGFLWIGRGAELMPPFSFGYLNLLAWAAIVPVSVSVAPLGAMVAHCCSVNVLRRVFALFMLVVAVKMGLDVL